MSTIQHRAWGYLIGNRWQTFAGIPYDEFVASVDDVVERLGWEVQREEDNPTSSERTVYGSDRGVLYRFSEPEFILRCISVSYDPLHKAVLSLGSSDEVIEQYRNSLTMVDVKSINDETRPQITEFLTQLVDEFEKPPWKFKHPRFDLAIVLRYRVKYHWKYWLGEGKARP